MLSLYSTVKLKEKVPWVKNIIENNSNALFLSLSSTNSASSSPQPTPAVVGILITDTSLHHCNATTIFSSNLRPLLHDKPPCPGGWCRDVETINMALGEGEENREIGLNRKLITNQTSFDPFKRVGDCWLLTSFLQSSDVSWQKIFGPGLISQQCQSCQGQGNLFSIFLCPDVSVSPTLC